MSRTSNFQPIRSANRRYISYRSRANKRRLFPAGPRSDLQDRAPRGRPRPSVVEQVAKRLAFLLLLLRSAVELGLGVGAHFGVASRGSRAPLPRRSGGRDRGSGHRPTAIFASAPRSFDRAVTWFDVGDDLGIEQGLLDLQKSLVVRLELLEHDGILGGDASRKALHTSNQQ